MMGDSKQVVYLVGVDWASSVLPGGAWEINTPPDRVMSTQWLRGDPATERMVVVVERNAHQPMTGAALRWYETVVLRTQTVLAP